MSCTRQAGSCSAGMCVPTGLPTAVCTNCACP
jgi:hypothetical protein